MHLLLMMICRFRGITRESGLCVAGQGAAGRGLAGQGVARQGYSVVDVVLVA